MCLLVITQCDTKQLSEERTVVAYGSRGTESIMEGMAAGAGSLAGHVLIHTQEAQRQQEMG